MYITGFPVFFFLHMAECAHTHMHGHTHTYTQTLIYISVSLFHMMYMLIMKDVRVCARESINHHCLHHLHHQNLLHNQQDPF